MFKIPYHYRIESLETPPLSPIPEDEIKEPSPSKTNQKLNRSNSRSEERRGSTNSTVSHRVNRGLSETPKKEKQPRSVKKTASEGTSRIEDDLRRMSSTKEHHHKEHIHHAESKDSPNMPKRYAKLKSSESSR